MKRLLLLFMMIGLVVMMTSIATASEMRGDQLIMTTVPTLSPQEISNMTVPMIATIVNSSR